MTIYCGGGGGGELHSSLWVRHEIIDIRLLEEGHHIYVFRRLGYTHHGIYIGDGRVIHFVGPTGGGKSGGKSGNACERCGLLRKMHHGVVETCLDCFLCGGSPYVYQYGMPKRVLQLSGHISCPTCTMRESKPDFEVVQTAKQKLEEGFGTYNLIYNNCEHFATFCKTGQSFGQQVGHSVRVAWHLLIL